TGFPVGRDLCTPRSCGRSGARLRVERPNVTVKDGVEDEFPGVWGKERARLGSGARRGSDGTRRHVGRRIGGRGAIRQKNCVFASGEEFGSFLGSGDGDVKRMRTQGAIIEFEKFASAGGKTCTNGKRPKGATQPERKLLASGLGLKFGNIRVGSSGEKEEFVKIAEADEIRFTLRKPGVLGEFTRRE